MDLSHQGEFLKDGKPIESTRRVENPREAAAYTFGYNPSLFVRRVHDILSVAVFVKNHEYTPDSVALVGLDATGSLAAVARTQTDDVVDRVAVDTNGFRFGSVDAIHDVNFMPGGAKYGDLPGMLSLSAPESLWLTGEGKQAPTIVKAAYQSADANDELNYVGNSKRAAKKVVDWLIKEIE